MPKWKTWRHRGGADASLQKAPRSRAEALVPSYLRRAQAESSRGTHEASIPTLFSFALTCTVQMGGTQTHFIDDRN